MLFLVRGKVGISVPFKHHDFLFPMDKTFLLLFLSLCLIFMLVGSSMAKLMMATLPPTQARTCYRITSQFLSVGRLETPGKVQRRTLPNFIYGNLSPIQPIWLVWGTCCVPTNTNHWIVLRQGEL